MGALHDDNDGGSIKKFGGISSRLGAIHERDGQMDGNRATAKSALTHSVAW